MEEWDEKLEELSNDIEDRNDVETPETHFTISYSSPFVEENKRRNEVRIIRFIKNQKSFLCSKPENTTIFLAH